MSVVEKARSLAKDPGHAHAMAEGWRHVYAELHARALKTRPRLKSFEVHHAIEHARDVFLAAYIDGQKPTNCILAAIAASGLRKGD